MKHTAYEIFIFVLIRLVIIDVIIDIRKSENFEYNKIKQIVNVSHDCASIFNVI